MLIWQIMAAFMDLFVPVFSALIIVRVVASYVARPDGWFYGAMSNLTEPILGPVRKVLPPLGGLDLAPLVTLFLLQGLQALVDGWFRT